uniref:Uncharacterized protein n=1 Tax=Metapenaeus joyneri majanivirus TaxID=2984280 RepID=A0A9C7EYU4_9VIRU|nr:MAG: hypothetical protein [Metapenaeus joyneri majanivirus]
MNTDFEGIEINRKQIKGLLRFQEDTKANIQNIINTQDLDRLIFNNFKNNITKKENSHIILLECLKNNTIMKPDTMKIYCSKNNSLLEISVLDHDPRKTETELVENVPLVPPNIYNSVNHSPKDHSNTLLYIPPYVDKMSIFIEYNENFGSSILRSGISVLNHSTWKNSKSGWNIKIVNIQPTYGGEIHSIDKKLVSYKVNNINNNNIYRFDSRNTSDINESYTEHKLGFLEYNHSPDYEKTKNVNFDSDDIENLDNVTLVLLVTKNDESIISKM